MNGNTDEKYFGASQLEQLAPKTRLKAVSGRESACMPPQRGRADENNNRDALHMSRRPTAVARAPRSVLDRVVRRCSISIVRARSVSRARPNVARKQTSGPELVSGRLKISP